MGMNDRFDIRTAGVDSQMKIGFYAQFQFRRKRFAVRRNNSDSFRRLFCLVGLRGRDCNISICCAAGDAVKIPYALMGSPELAELVSEYMQDFNCGLMENHGVITVGNSLLNAFDRMELLENAAKQTIMAHSIVCRSLTGEQLLELDRFAGRK